MHKRTFFAAILFVILLAFSAGFFFVKVRPGVLGTYLCNFTSPCSEGPQPPVTVTGFIRIIDVAFKVYPEKRIPPAGNWDTFADVVLKSCSSSYTRSFNNIPTDTTGYGVVPIPSANPLPAGSYRFFIRGFSHLNRQFNCYSLNGSNPYIDLTPESKLLLAGEVSNVYDNYINSLDISVLVNKLFTGDYKNDLNQDTKVNSLDLGNQVYNIFTPGD
jgi:hypothetical protein